ncbi:Microtubule-associated protein 70-2 [Cocos nucifera]|uniref:Microtubule-associated protein 70-2 n=1 Tax=Cocos nucifera TaxID=13894 RepID=A0A8K0MYN5_COCNU|nr:Microtubule-associated protein 70-2 [Cocos nucifera]
MADPRGGGEGTSAEAAGGNAAPSLLTSGMFKGESRSAGAPRQRAPIRASLDAEEFINLLHGSDPVRVELSRLELENEVRVIMWRQRLMKHRIPQNLEIKKINDEKKASMAAQFAAEATLRRVDAAQRDDDITPLEANLAPVEAELKLARQEIVKLQDDNRALDRLTKSKEAALLEAERTVQIALVKASMVHDLQNKNQELMKQIEICQEENKISDKLHRQKVAEVEKLSQTVRELEEAVLAGGAAANAVRDYQQKVQEMNEEKKTLDRELARAKVTANRVAVVVANERKDANDKVMPVKQWLEERRFMQGEMQQLRDKLSIAERTARCEAQLKEKFQLRIKVLEEGLRISSSCSSHTNLEGKSASNGPSRRQSLGGAESVSKSSPNGFLPRRSSSFQLKSTLSRSTSAVLKLAKGTSKSFDGGTSWKDNPDEKLVELTKADTNDTVSGLYDILQKEVIILRKACHEKDQSLKDKDDAIEMLAKKVDTLTKAMEVEAKKMRREVVAMEKEVAAIRAEKEQDNRAKRLGSSKGSVNTSQMLPGRYV